MLCIACTRHYAGAHLEKFMKKFILLILVFSTAFCVFAENLTEDKDVTTLNLPDDGRLKVGALLGYPSGITAGYRFSNWFETNLTVGYNPSFANGALLSSNAMFTLVQIPVKGAGIMPLSLGPQVNVIVGNRFFRVDLVGNLRLEYTFPEIPLNLFLEGGFGFRFFNGADWMAWHSALGVRYVFK